MPWKKNQCKERGCERMTMSLGQRKQGFEKEYDEKGFLIRKKVKMKSYYSNYCRIHQKTYNRKELELSPALTSPLILALDKNTA